ncbi:MAG: hypothetical protein FJZ15_04410 [Candidatus Omnitrophica bacterium]|nr:hypothetical protein [Candidatus Omnitrophota bacterium]
MSKRLIMMLTLAFVVGISFAAFAEVQNVRVSGDITIGAVYRNNFDLAKTPVNQGRISPGLGGAIPANESTYQDKQEDMFSIVRVRVDADLTDNVSATVRLLNERNWNGDNINGLAENNRNIGLAARSTANKESQIDIDLAYVTLKEFLYSPLTLTVGRQEMRFGNGWIIGDPDTNLWSAKTALAEGDLSLRKSFDAVRATLDYNPLIVDIIYAKIAENNTVLNDDIDLSGINATYELSKATTLEGFAFAKITGANSPNVTNLDQASANPGVNNINDFNKADKVFTVGGRVVNKSIKNLTIDAQGAFQFGTYNPKFDPNSYNRGTPLPGLDNQMAQVGNRRAWGTEVMAMYDLKDISGIAKYKPMIGAAYVYLSGEARDRTGNKTYHGWDPMFEDQTFGHIINAIMGFSNATLGGLTFSAKPMDDVTAKFDYVAAWVNKEYATDRLAILSGVPTARTFNMHKGHFLGSEYDLTLTYDYTEDVQFSLLGGLFVPNKIVNAGRDPNGTALAAGGAHDLDRAVATEVVGTMKVTF